MVLILVRNTCLSLLTWQKKVILGHRHWKTDCANCIQENRLTLVTQNRIYWWKMEPKRNSFIKHCFYYVSAHLNDALEKKYFSKQSNWLLILLHDVIIENYGNILYEFIYLNNAGNLCITNISLCNLQKPCIELHYIFCLNKNILLFLFFVIVTQLPLWPPGIITFGLTSTTATLPMLLIFVQLTLQLSYIPKSGGMLNCKLLFIFFICRILQEGCSL